MMQTVIFGCGDVGRRVARYLINIGLKAEDIHAYVNSVASAELCAEQNVLAQRVDLDDLQRNIELCNGRELYYTVAPQKQGTRDERSRSLLESWQVMNIKPVKVVLISTTGVYGDCDGAWIDEQAQPNPQTDRGKRRLDSEQVWLAWGKQNRVPVVTLRVPGIYSYSRLPRERLQKKIPVVNPAECGYTNRIHADDLAQVCVKAMRHGEAGQVFNATDGTPGKISEYLQLAAKVLGLSVLPEISMEQAKQELSAGMLSYLRESRRISNEKVLSLLNVELIYPDYRDGIKV